MTYIMLYAKLYFMIRFILFAVLYVVVASTSAQVYHDMTKFPIYGTLAPDATQSFSRLPDSLHTKVRDGLWYHGQHSAGLSIRFATDATSIYVKFKPLNNFVMNHMAPTGIKGMDLYVLQPGNKWTLVGTAIPSSKGETSTSFVKNMPKRGMHEYMLFLPLYDGLDYLHIGVNKGAVLKKPIVNLPSRKKPVVFYGTSIVQGGCASRPGMAHTNILQRKLNREVINLGFSGNGKLDLEIADMMAKSDAGAFVIDVLPNNTVKSLTENLEPFYKRLRESHPSTPIILVENALNPRTRFDSSSLSNINALNNTLHTFYDNKIMEGDKNLYYFQAEEILDDEAEGTVDGIHLTDYGFKHFAEALYPLLQKVLTDNNE